MSCQGQSVICQPWSITHPHPPGWGAARAAGDPHSHRLTRGTLALLSGVAQKPWAEQGAELPAPSPPPGQDRRENGKMPRRGEGSAPEVFSATKVFFSPRFPTHFPLASPSALGCFSPSRTQADPQTFNPRVLWMLQAPACGFCVLMGSEDPLPGLIPGIPGRASPGRVSAAAAAQTLQELRARRWDTLGGDPIPPSTLKAQQTPSLAGPSSGSRVSGSVPLSRAAPKAVPGPGQQRGARPGAAVPARLSPGQQQWG